jgi:hypothetical protein
MPVKARRDVRFDHWEDFKSRLYEILHDPSTDDDSSYIFRGQANAEWALMTSFSRTFRMPNLSSVKGFQEKLEKHFKREMILAEGQEAGSKATWTIGQHHGLPTPLLDWSYSPYVAAFFAAEGALRGILQEMSPGDAYPDKHFCIIALRMTGAKGETEEIWKTMNVEFKEDSSAENPRIRSQRGVFTQLPLTHLTLNECVIDYEQREALKEWLLCSFNLPYSQAVPALKDLELMDINFRRLYGGREGICLSARLKAQLEHFETQLRRR